MFAIHPIKAAIFDTAENGTLLGVLYLYEVSFPGTKRKNEYAYGFQFAAEADDNEKLHKWDYCHFGGRKFLLEAADGSNYYMQQSVAEEIMAKCQMNLMLSGRADLERVEANMKFKYAPKKFGSYVGMHEVVFPREKTCRKLPIKLFGNQIFDTGH